MLHARQRMKTGAYRATKLEASTRVIYNRLLLWGVIWTPPQTGEWLVTSFGHRLKENTAPLSAYYISDLAPLLLWSVFLLEPLTGRV